MTCKNNHPLRYHYGNILYFLKNFNSEFSYNELWFRDQNFNPLEMEDKINITLVIN